MRQQLRELAGALGRQPREHVLEIGIGVVPVEPGRLNQAHHHSRTLASPQRTRKQPVGPADCNRPDLVLDMVVRRAASGAWRSPRSPSCA